MNAFNQNQKTAISNKNIKMSGLKSFMIHAQHSFP